MVRTIKKSPIFRSLKKFIGASRSKRNYRKKTSKNKKSKLSWARKRVKIGGVAPCPQQVYEKLDFLKNKEVDIICSGPSSENIKLNTNIVIAANNSIVNSSFNNKDNKKIVIWILGPNYRYINMDNYKSHHIFRDTIPRIKTNIDYLFIRYSGNETKFNFFSDKIKEIFNDIIIKKLQLKRISCGFECLDLAIKNNIKKMYVSGIELGKESSYNYNKEFDDLYKTKPNKIRHLDADIAYLKNIKREDLDKINPSNRSGLYRFIKENMKEFRY